MTLRWLAPVLAGLLLAAGPASACPFCNPTGQTLTGEVSQADFIVYGTLSNARLDPGDTIGKGTTDLSIELVIKPHDAIKGKKSVTIPRYLPPPPDGKPFKQLVFFNVINGQFDAYRGEQFPPDSKLPEYLKGAIEVRAKDTVTRLRYFFDYLESPDLTISTDAYAEFGFADYKEIREVAPKLPAETLQKWLKDPNTRGSRLGLYGLLLGHCGKAGDAKAIRALLDDQDRSFTSGLDGVVAGYVLLDPKAGWDYLLTLIKDPNKDFPVRYATLKTVRFFYEYRPDVVPQPQSLEAMKLLMDVADIADMPIADLRKWKVWSLTPTVLGYAARESHNSVPITQREILKFAIAAAAADPANKAAADYVAAAKAKDPKRVQFLEELLKDELKPAPTPNQAATKPPAAPANPK